MRVVVTGGAGFIGSHLVERLLHDGHVVHAVDSLVQGSRRNLWRSVPAGVRLHETDVRSTEMRDILMHDQIDVVVHLAGRPDVRSSFANPVGETIENLVGTISVLEACRLAGVRRVIVASSASVYGFPHKVPTPEDDPGTRRSPYGISIRAIHEHLEYYRSIHRLEPTAVVLSNVYGPRQQVHNGVVARFLAAQILQRPAMLFGTGLQTRDFVYVDDAVDAFSRLVTTPTAGAVNIGSGVETSILGLWEGCGRVTGSSMEPTFGPRMPGEPERMALDVTRAREMLGWIPRTSIDHGIALTADWMRHAMMFDAGPLEAAIERAGSGEHATSLPPRPRGISPDTPRAS